MRSFSPGRRFLIVAVVVLISILTTGQEVPAKRSSILIKFTTSFGDIVIELFEDKAPKSAANFLAYAEDGFFEGTVFHRVIPGFVIQGGGMTADMKQKSTKNPIRNEGDNGLKNLKYTLSMARTQDPHSATSQFFINLSDNAFLDHTAKSDQGWGYAVFGQVVEGTDVVDKIAGVETGTRGFHEDVPVEAVSIDKVEIVK